MEMNGCSHRETDLLDATAGKADPSLNVLIAKVINTIGPYWDVFHQ